MTVDGSFWDSWARVSASAADDAAGLPFFFSPGDCRFLTTICPWVTPDFRRRPPGRKPDARRATEVLLRRKPLAACLANAFRGVLHGCYSRIVSRLSSPVFFWIVPSALFMAPLTRWPVSPAALPTLFWILP